MIQNPVLQNANKGLQLIQLAAWDMILIIDSSRMMEKSKLNAFLKDLFENPEIQKVGNGLQAKEARSMVNYCGGKVHVQCSRHTNFV